MTAIFLPEGGSASPVDYKMEHTGKIPAVELSVTLFEPGVIGSGNAAVVEIGFFGNRTDRFGHGGGAG